jgi:hypothetical protein
MTPQETADFENIAETQRQEERPFIPASYFKGMPPGK